MKGLIGAVGCLFLLVSTADAEMVRSCRLGHFVRNGGNEIFLTSVGVRNHDRTNPIRIERVTIRNLFGAVVHDSVAFGHPLNTDLDPDLDITVVPPGAAYYLSTNHIWQFDSLPAEDGGNQGGIAMTGTLRISAPEPRLVEVTASGRMRERVSAGGPFFAGRELSATGTSKCRKLGRDDD